MKRTEATDETTRAILYDGANLSQLGMLFRMDHRSIVAKIHKIKPIGVRNGVDIYAVHEVAPYLVRPAYDIETYIKGMNHADLPKMVTKEFWAGMRSRQAYEKEAGDLWPTARVVEVLGGIMKSFKMATRLMVDSMERQTSLSPHVRNMIRQAGDGMLNELYRTIQIEFSKAPTNPRVIEMAQQSVEQVREDKEDDDEL